MFLFCNTEIRLSKKPLYFKSFIQSNIFYLKDIWDFERNNFISTKDLLIKLKITRNWIAEWNILKSSIPKRYVEALKNDVVLKNKTNNSIYFDGIILMNKSRNIIQPDNIALKQLTKQ